MFYKVEVPAIDATTYSDEEYAGDCQMWSDCHKDAFGCRPNGLPMPGRDTMQAAMAELGAWMEEDSKIQEMRETVARFDLERSLRYHVGRGDAHDRASAFRVHMRHLDPHLVGEGNFDAAYACYHLRLPYSCEKDIQALWDEGA